LAQHSLREAGNELRVGLLLGWHALDHALPRLVELRRALVQRVEAVLPGARAREHVRVARIELPELAQRLAHRASGRLRAGWRGDGEEHRRCEQQRSERDEQTMAHVRSPWSVPAAGFGSYLPTRAIAANQPMALR